MTSRVMRAAQAWCFPSVAAGQWLMRRRWCRASWGGVREKRGGRNGWKKHESKPRKQLHIQLMKVRLRGRRASFCRLHGRSRSPKNENSRLFSSSYCVNFQKHPCYVSAASSAPRKAHFISSLHRWHLVFILVGRKMRRHINKHRREQASVAGSLILQMGQQHALLSEVLVQGPALAALL